VIIASTRFSIVHDTRDHYSKEVRDHERHGDVRKQAVQFADRAFRLLSARLRKGPVLGFVAVCVGAGHHNRRQWSLVRVGHV